MESIYWQENETKRWMHVLDPKIHLLEKSSKAVRLKSTTSWKFEMPQKKKKKKNLWLRVWERERERGRGIKDNEIHKY